MDVGELLASVTTKTGHVQQYIDPTKAGRANKASLHALNQDIQRLGSVLQRIPSDLGGRRAQELQRVLAAADRVLERSMELVKQEKEMSRVAKWKGSKELHPRFQQLSQDIFSVFESEWTVKRNFGQNEACTLVCSWEFVEIDSHKKKTVQVGETLLSWQCANVTPFHLTTM